MSMLKEFQEFAMKGNVVDLAVGVIMGAAFGPIVTTLVGNVVMPPIGLALGQVDFSALGITLRDAAAGKDAVMIKYGLFINAIINFVLTAGAVFLLVKAMNTAKKRFEKEKAAEASAAPPRQEVLLEQILAALKK